MVEVTSPSSEEPKKPVSSNEFWQERIYNTIAKGGMLHEIIYQNSYEVWEYAQGYTSLILQDDIPPGSKILDAGCGYGALLCCIEQVTNRVGIEYEYTGVDNSPDLIRLAKARYPGKNFICWNLNHLPFMDREFDYCVCRSMRQMIRGNLGEEAWKSIQTELERVSKYLLITEYPQRLKEHIPVEIINCETGEKIPSKRKP